MAPSYGNSVRWMTTSFHHLGTNPKPRLRTGGPHQWIPPPHLLHLMWKIPSPALQKLHWQITPQHPQPNWTLRPRRTCWLPRPLVLAELEDQVAPTTRLWEWVNWSPYPIWPYNKRKAVCINFDSLHGDPEFGEPLQWHLTCHGPMVKELAEEDLA